MTADVTQDRRVTVPTRGPNHTGFVDGSRLFWALLSPVHERLGYRVLAPDRIEGDAVASALRIHGPVQGSRHVVHLATCPDQPRARRRQHRAALIARTPSVLPATLASRAASPPLRGKPLTPGVAFKKGPPCDQCLAAIVPSALVVATGKRPMSNYTRRHGAC